MTRRAVPEAVVDLLLLAVAAVWGASFLAAKELSAESGVASALALRFLVATAGLGLLCLARRERLPRGQGYVLYFEGLPEPVSSDLDTAVLQINQAMEHTIRQCPTQYLWGYGRYKQPRQEAPAAESATEGGAA